MKYLKLNEKTFLILFIIFNIFMLPILAPDGGHLIRYSKLRDYSDKNILSEDSANDKNLSLIFESSNNWDVFQYMKISKGESLGSPFDYRKAYPLAVSYLSEFWYGQTKETAPIAYTAIYLNFLLCIIIFILSYILFKPISNYPLLISFVIISSPSILYTIPTLMLEIPCVLCLLILMMYNTNRILMAVTLIFSMFVKEVFVLLSIPLFIYFLMSKEKKIFSIQSYSSYNFCGNENLV